ncbi:MAG: aminotransferase class I/II-fold pyridoxal phosphate-dependent enzyme [Archangiaceae bacterium]|nr:aminotransferase class I/II-fold pyridoxal phosphate-dependent enzyme [Archangiaceae bacterium]
MIDLSANENPLGPSEQVRAKLAAATVERYPDSSARALRARLAAMHGCELEQVCVGAGSTDLIFHLVAAFGAGGELVAPRHSFIAWRLATQYTRTSYREAGAGLTTDLHALLAAITPDTTLVCVVNPANPTGAFVPQDELLAFLALVPADVVVVLDEAYADYVEPPAACLGAVVLRSHPNVVVLRTFSKAYGLAGLRVGYALGAATTIGALERRRPPFSVSAPAQSAALAALDDVHHLETTVHLAQRERLRVGRALTGLGFEVLPSQANFLCVRTGDGELAASALKANGVAVMPLSTYGLPEWVRITLGTVETNDRLVASMTMTR